MLVELDARKHGYDWWSCCGYMFPLYCIDPSQLVPWKACEISTSWLLSQATSHQIPRRTWLYHPVHLTSRMGSIECTMERRTSSWFALHAIGIHNIYYHATAELIQKLQSLRLGVCNSLPAPFPRRHMLSSWLFPTATSELSVNHNTQIRYPTTTISTAPPMRLAVSKLFSALPPAARVAASPFVSAFPETFRRGALGTFAGSHRPVPDYRSSRLSQRGRVSLSYSSFFGDRFNFLNGASGRMPPTLSIDLMPKIQSSLSLFRVFFYSA
ncbi:hypothetical protein AB1N83_009806 [Pleurotus pulmonarius]